ncbi:MAG: helix-hairpin-helix domain-containing protein [Chlorobi bacterium]|nr:helix-hairpin-helix domain-containing protein [Chlorobiota bacterium]
MEGIERRGATRLMTQYTKNMIIGFSIPVFFVIGYKAYKHITTKKLYECIYYTMPENPSLWIDVNTATVEELASLPSISKPIAKRIVSYRNWIGGFHSISQLEEIGWWNIHDLTFSKKVLYIEPNFQPRKLRIYYTNLVKHPYFTPRMAWWTVKLKREGRLSQWKTVIVDSLRLCNDSLANKLEPYIPTTIPSRKAKWHDKGR